VYQVSLFDLLEKVVFMKRRKELEMLELNLKVASVLIDYI
jgi:hypothetical protein